MKKSLSLITVLAVSLMVALPLSAAQPEKPAKKDAPKEKKLSPQTLCPVMGGEIDSSAYIDIQGQRVYFCCPMCSKKMKADPDTYFKKAAEAGVLFENVQTTCPVSGKELDKKEIYTDYEGRRIYFCCEGCVATFNKDPQKFLSAMDAPEAKKTK